MKKLMVFLLCLCTLSSCAVREKTPDEWQLKDFDGCFKERHETTSETYSLLQGTPLENTVHVLHGEQDGPVIYVVAGVHGDEEAGWRAGNLLKTVTLKAGTLYIVSPANRYGAEAVKRKTKDGYDLNRAFPGSAEGNDAQQIAHAIYNDIAHKQPQLVLDLHEAIPKTKDYATAGYNYDALGNSLICYSLDGIGDLVVDLLLETETRTLCSTPFILYNAPPEGSINHTAWTLLDTPAITIETLRSDPLKTRVQNQLEIVQYILTDYGLR